MGFGMFQQRGCRRDARARGHGSIGRDPRLRRASRQRHRGRVPRRSARYAVPHVPASLYPYSGSDSGNAHIINNAAARDDRRTGFRRGDRARLAACARRPSSSKWVFVSRASTRTRTTRSAYSSYPTRTIAGDREAGGGSERHSQGRVVSTLEGVTTPKRSSLRGRARESGSGVARLVRRAVDG